MAEKRMRVLVEGRVQGVFFRANTKKKAEKLGLSGWVKNLDDGRVEAVFEGEGKGLQEILGFCERGPKLAKVEDVSVEYGEVEGLEGFKVLR